MMLTKISLDLITSTNTFDKKDENLLLESDSKMFLKFIELVYVYMFEVSTKLQRYRGVKPQFL